MSLGYRARSTAGLRSAARQKLKSKLQVIVYLLIKITHTLEAPLAN